MGKASRHHVAALEKKSGGANRDSTPRLPQALERMDSECCEP